MGLLQKIRDRLRPVVLVNVEYEEVGVENNPLYTSQRRWESSGGKTSSEVIKDHPGLLGGVLVTALDSDGDIVVEVYDNALAAAGTLLAEVRVTATTAGAQASFGAPAGGVVAHEGIYLEIFAGDCSVVAYYN